MAAKRSKAKPVRVGLTAKDNEGIAATPTADGLLQAFPNAQEKKETTGRVLTKPPFWATLVQECSELRGLDQVPLDLIEHKDLEKGSGPTRVLLPSCHHPFCRGPQCQLRTKGKLQVPTKTGSEREEGK